MNSMSTTKMINKIPIKFLWMSLVLPSGLLFVIWNIILKTEFYIYFPIVLGVLGAMLNLIGVLSNQMRMPVYVPTENPFRKKFMINSKYHNVIEDRSKIKFFFLCDRFVFMSLLRHRKGYFKIAIISLGDMFIYLCIILSIFNIIFIF